LRHLAVLVQRQGPAVALPCLLRVHVGARFVPGVPTRHRERLELPYLRSLVLHCARQRSGTERGLMADKDEDSIVFAQVDGNLDTHPKVRKAGSFGRQVFEFVLRRNALRGSKGHVPISLVDPDYLADLLMISRDDAVTGVTKAVTACLIEIDDAAGLVRIVGWHPSWGRRPKSGAERTDKWRAKQKGKTAKSPDQVTDGDVCDEETSHVTDGDESDVSEVEKKREEIPEIHTRARDRHAAAGGIVAAVWKLGAARCGELKIANIPSVAPWPLMSGSSDPGRIAALDRVCELLVATPPAEVERIAINRVEVAYAKALADRDGGYFAPLTMFTPNSFATWAHLDPQTIGRKPAQPNRTPKNGAIGASTPHKDFGTESKPAKEVM
jgi:hypothetical protein